MVFCHGAGVLLLSQGILQEERLRAAWAVNPTRPYEYSIMIIMLKPYHKTLMYYDPPVLPAFPESEISF